MTAVCDVADHIMICCMLASGFVICLQEHILSLVQEALKLADARPADISCIAYTKVGQQLHAS